MDIVRILRTCPLRSRSCLTNRCSDMRRKKNRDIARVRSPYMRALPVPAVPNFKTFGICQTIALVVQWFYPSEESLIPPSLPFLFFLPSFARRHFLLRANDRPTDPTKQISWVFAGTERGSKRCQISSKLLYNLLRK